MARKRTSKSYTIQPFQIRSDQSEIDLLMINFRADNLTSAQAQAMINARNNAFMEDIHGLNNNAEVWRWLKRGELGLKAKGVKA
jgi:hypothetical protein